MKKFKNLQFTYDKLVEEIEFLKGESLIHNAEYNETNDKLKKAKDELDEVRQKLKEEKHQAEADIKNFNKNYEEDLKYRDNKARSLHSIVMLEKKELQNESIELAKKDIGLQTKEEELNSLQRQLSTKEGDLNKRGKEIEDKDVKMNTSIKEFDKDIKKKTKEKIELDIYVQGLRNEAIKIYDSQKGDRDYILQQTHSLDDREKDLKEKEEKIASDMKELLSAQQHTNE